MSIISSETANLVALLKLNDQFSGPLKNATKTLSGFDAKLGNTSTRAYKAGQQIGTGIKNGLKIAAVGLTSLVGLLLLSAKEGQAAASVQKIYATALANSGKVAASQLPLLEAQRKALEDLGGVDDELIKQEQTRLIQMGLTGDQVLKLTPLILDFSKATGTDLLTATKLVGKAVEGNTGALSRYGVLVDKAKAKVDPFTATQEALNKSFGGTTKALSGELDTRLAALREHMADVREEAGQKLLPSLIKITDVVGRKLVPAFGTLIDAILPSALTGLNKLAAFLESGGATEGVNRLLKTARDLAPIIQKSAEISGKVITTAVNLFKSLPPEIQSLAVAGLAINKLTGGLVTNLAGGLISAVISSFKGFMNINATAVYVNGPAGGLGGGLGGAAGGVLSTAVPVTILGFGAFAVTQMANGALVGQGLNGNFQTPGSGNLPFGIDSSIRNLTTAIDIFNQTEQRKAGPEALRLTADRHLGEGFDNTAAALRTADRHLGGFAAALDPNTTATLGLTTSILGLSTITQKQADAIYAASAEARGLKGTGKATGKIDKRLEFLRSGASDAKLVVVAEALVTHFERGTAKQYTSSRNQERTLSALRSLQARLLARGDTKAAAAIGGDIRRMERRIARGVEQVKTQTALGRAAGLSIAKAVKALKLSVKVDNTVKTATYLNGRLFDSATNRYKSVILGSKGTFAEFG